VRRRKTSGKAVPQVRVVYGGDGESLRAAYRLLARMILERKADLRCGRRSTSV